MISDLPAPRDTSNILTRTLVIFFGQGYALVGFAVVAYVCWHLLLGLLPQRQAIDFAHPVMPTFVDYAQTFVVTLLRWFIDAIVILVIAVGAGNLFNGRPIDIAGCLGVLRARWRTLVAVALLWMITSEILFELFLIPRTILAAVNRWWFESSAGIYLDPALIAQSLVKLCATWSFVSIAFTSARVVRAYLDGLIDPWRLGWRSLLIVVAFLASPDVRWLLYGVSANALERAPAIVTTIARNLVQSLLLTLLTILVTVAFIENQEQRAPSQHPELAAIPS